MLDGGERVESLFEGGRLLRHRRLGGADLLSRTPDCGRHCGFRSASFTGRTSDCLYCAEVLVGHRGGLLRPAGGWLFDAEHGIEAVLRTASPQLLTRDSRLL